MNPQPTIMTPNRHDTAKQVLGVEVTVLSKGEASCGLAVCRQVGAAGMGPPPHSHDWDEMFYVARGSVDFHCDGKTTRCEYGSLIHIPANSVHAFNFGPEGGEMLELTGEGSHAPQMFSAIDAEIPAGEPDIPKLLGVLDRYGVSVHL